MFRFFAAPLQTAEGYVADGHCSLCGQDARDAFRLGVGADVIVTCSTCGRDTAVDAEQGATPCHHCGAVNEHTLGDEITVCVDCLVAGRVALTKDTEVGLFSWEDLHEAADSGGAVAPDAVDDETAAQRRERAEADPAAIAELLRTPDYPTYQGQRWLLHHHLPMRYIGRWGAEEFRRRAGDEDPRAFFERTCEDGTALFGAHESEVDAWELLTAPERRTLVGVYMFECAECDTLRGTWDLE